MNESLRLLLQHIVDNDGNAGYPSSVTHALKAGVDAGFITIEKIGGPISFWDKYRITQDGRKALDVVNKELGEKATRLVHGWVNFQGRAITFGGPYHIPISAPTKRVQGTLCMEQEAI